MSRIRRYAFALFSGYTLLAINTGYTLASVPLALSYLSKAEFGLWALVAQIGGYLLLIDLGIGSASARILVDFKDHRDDAAYGSMLKTSLLVACAQAAVLLLIGGFLFFLTRKGWDSEPLSQEFSWLLLGHCSLLAAGLPFGVFDSVLWAHQRQDAHNYSHMAAFVARFAALWTGFALGEGVYSLFWAEAAGTLTARSGVLLACLRLRLLPAIGRWGKASFEQFRELFAFGKDVFLFALGSQMINTSQTLLVAPLLGLEAAGIWSVCLRTFNLVNQIVRKVSDVSSTALSEMLVRGEWERFSARFKSVTVLSLGLAAAGAVFFAFGNRPFVEVWTGGRVEWDQRNDFLLALWMILLIAQRCHTGLLGVRKDLGTVKYVFLLEGAVFITLACVATVKGAGFAGIVGSSILATVCFSFTYGHHRSRVDFSLPVSALAAWWRAPIKILSFLTPIMATLAWFTRDLPPVAFLIVATVVCGPIACRLLLRDCIDPDLRKNLLNRLPARGQTLFRLLAGEARLAG